MASLGETGASIVGRLEDASRQHEVDVVIDLGMDRVIKWVGVYLILALAVLAKITESITTNLTCYPANQSVSASAEFIAFTTTFCWETSHDVTNNNVCSRANVTNNVPLLRNPNHLKYFIQWLPYIMMLQGLIFMFPWAFWHFRVGARLLGHLKFMQLLLEDIFNQLQYIPEARYREEPYDETSDNFDGRRKYKPVNKFQPFLTTSVLVAEIHKQVQTKTSLAPPSTKADYNELTPWNRLVVGKMKDRHFFSMLCYENFASMHHLPYILSVFKLCEALNKEGPKKKFYPLNESILYQWCHEENFNNTFLVKTYVYKHIITGIVAFVMTSLMTWFLVSIYSDVTSSETFGCQLPYNEICALCTIRRKRDVIAMFCCDFILVITIMFLSLGNWLVVRGSSDRATCHYFDHMKETCNVALLRAKYAKEAKENN